MTPAPLNATEQLRKLIDDYAVFTDEKNIAEQVKLFTPEIVYSVFMNGAQVSSLSGRENIEHQFNQHAAVVKNYFTMNGQHIVNLEGQIATGVSYSQMKMVREVHGKANITDYSVKYEDKYRLVDGKWRIDERVAHFVIVEARTLNGDI